MNILFIGDVFGSTGRRLLAENLPRLKEQHAIDVCIANGENSAGGIGITVNSFKKLRKYGVDIITGGNHSFAHLHKEPQLNEFRELLRPHNLPPGNPGCGMIITTVNNYRIGVLNLLGRTFLNHSADCPFREGKSAVERIREQTPIILVDFHAEASAEKVALGYYLDGMVSAVVGTHTHVQTADERILPGGTAYITDVGSTGPQDSVIGMKKQAVIQRFLLQTYIRMEPAERDPLLNAVVIAVDEHSGKAQSITRLYQRIDFA